MTDTRTMIVMDADSSRFQFRAGALIRSHGHILIHRNASDAYWALPGGRVEFHEAAAETLAREIEEELGRSATIGPLRLVIENFFELDGRKCHELGFYYDAELSTPLPFHDSEVVHRSVDGSSELEFRWALPTAAALTSFDLKPAPLLDLIGDMPETVAHVTHRDR